nr:hypothetical protein CFP56_03160 [Quercus suber]
MAHSPMYPGFHSVLTAIASHLSHSERTSSDPARSHYVHLIGQMSSRSLSGLSSVEIIVRGNDHVCNVDQSPVGDRSSRFNQSFAMTIPNPSRDIPYNGDFDAYGEPCDVPTDRGVEEPELFDMSLCSASMVGLKLKHDRLRVNAFASKVVRASMENERIYVVPTGVSAKES